MSDAALRDDPALGVALMIGFALLAPWTAVLVKIIDPAMPSIQINAARFTVQIGMFGGLMAILARGLPARPRPLWPLLMRGALMATGSALLYAGFRAMPIADVAAIFFLEPLLATLFAGIFLGERIGWRRISAVLVGLIGAWIVIGPRFETLGAAALYPFLSAIVFAVTATVTRRFSRLGNAPTMQFYASLIGAGLLWSAAGVGTALGLGGMIAPHWRDIWLLLGVGVGASATSLMISNAFRVTRISVVTPFQYLELPMAAAAGWVAFSEAVSLNTALGAGLILGAGLFVIWRERALAKR